MQVGHLVQRVRDKRSHCPRREQPACGVANAAGAPKVCQHRKNEHVPKWVRDGGEPHKQSTGRTQVWANEEDP